MRRSSPRAGPAGQDVCGRPTCRRRVCAHKHTSCNAARAPMAAFASEGNEPQAGRRVTKAFGNTGRCIERKPARPAKGDVTRAFSRFAGGVSACVWRAQSASQLEQKRERRRNEADLWGGFEWSSSGLGGLRQASAQPTPAAHKRRHGGKARYRKQTSGIATQLQLLAHPKASQVN